MSEQDLKEIVATGDRLPASMFDPALLEVDHEIVLPVFDGEKVVDQREE